MADRNTVSGIHGLVSAGAFSKHCSGWSLDIEQDTPEDTNWCDWQDWPEYENWRTYLPGLRGWSGSFDAFLDENMGSGLIPGSGPFTGKFYIKYDEDAGVYVGFQGQILISTISGENATDDVASLSVDFQGTGPVTIGDLTGSTTT